MMEVKNVLMLEILFMILIINKSLCLVGKFGFHFQDDGLEAGKGLGGHNFDGFF